MPKNESSKKSLAAYSGESDQEFRAMAISESGHGDHGKDGKAEIEIIPLKKLIGQGSHKSKVK